MKLWSQLLQFVPLVALLIVAFKSWSSAAKSWGKMQQMGEEQEKVIKENKKLITDEIDKIRSECRSNRTMCQQHIADTISGQSKKLTGLDNMAEKIKNDFMRVKDHSLVCSAQTSKIEKHITNTMFAFKDDIAKTLVALEERLSKKIDRVNNR